MAERPKARKPAGRYDPAAYSGAEGGFPYAAIPQRVPEKHLRAYAALARKRCDRLTKGWDATRNAEWMLRAYVAVKHLMTATAALSSACALPPEPLPMAAIYPVLVHRGLSAAARVLVHFLSDAEWDDGALLTLPYDRVAALARGAVAPLDAGQARALGLTMGAAGAYHGALHPDFSERAVEVVRLDQALPAARFLCELAQWHSEVLAAALAEHLEPPIGYDFGVLVSAGGGGDDPGAALLDDTDARRIGALFGTAPHPASLSALIAEHLADETETLWADAGAHPEVDRRLVFPLG